MVNYVYRVHHKTTLCCSNVILPSSLSLSKCLAILISPLPPVDCFSYFIYCVYAICDCRLLLPVLAGTLEEMINPNDDIF